MGKIRIGVFIGLDLLAAVLIELFIYSYIDQMKLVENLPDGKFNAAFFMAAASILLNVLVAVLLSIVFLSRLPRPKPMNQSKRKKVALLTMICGFYVIYRFVWTAYSFVGSLTRPLGTGKNLTKAILSGPLEFLCDKLAEGAIALTQSVPIYWLFTGILPNCIISAAIFTALHGVFLLRKTPAQTAV